MAIVLLVVFGSAFAGELKVGHSPAVADDHFDWEFAQKIWSEMNTVEALEAEYAKYSSDFEPWLKFYKQNEREALQALNEYPKDKRNNIKRGYDVQLAFDEWFDHVYSPWYNHYPYVASQAPLHKAKAPTFDDYLASYGSRPSCIPKAMLDECGPVPDWRSPEWKAKEQAMMRKANQQAAEAEAKRAAKYGKR